MEASYSSYDHVASADRVDEILDAPAGNFEELDSIPARTRLSFTNGFYVNCSCLFVDLRDSSELPKKHKRPTLAKIYRSFISECVAVMNGNSRVAEVNIHGDAVWGVFDTPYRNQIDEVFSTAARLNSLVKLLNCRFRKRGIDPIRAGVGADWGRALMIKAGYKGSAVNEVVWMGDVINTASNLSGQAARLFSPPVMVSSVFYSNLNDENQKLMAWNASGNCYAGNIVNVAMDEWWERNCQ